MGPEIVQVSLLVLILNKEINIFILFTARELNWNI